MNCLVFVVILFKNKYISYIYIICMLYVHVCMLYVHICMCVCIFTTSNGNGNYIITCLYHFITYMSKNQNAINFSGK